MNLLIVDDHQVILDGIKNILPEDKFKIVAEANDVETALRFLNILDVDAIITDIQLNGRSGIDLVREAKAQRPGIKCLILSMFDEKTMVQEAMDAGADAYIIKSSDPEQFTKALEKVSKGEKFLCEDLSVLLLQKESLFEKAKNLLTLREKEILRLVVDEKSNKQIARELFISERTVESHRKNIYRKTNTESLVGLVRFAIDNKLV